MANPNFAPSISTNEVWRNLDTSRCLTDDLDAIESDISDLESGKADSNHTHTEYAAASHEHTGYATEDHTHDGYAAEDHTHSGYATEDHTHTGYASSSHSHAQSEITGLETALSGKANASHTHSGYATEDHTHSEYASVSHGHSGYASSGHTHSEYADADHSHSEYFNANTGGSIGGTTNVNGVFRVQGQQMIYFNEDSNSQTFGTNNATGGTTICCGSSATVGVNGALMKTPTILPRATGTFSCGNANFRWSGIYSTSAVNVSSDERMKRDISEADEEALAEFINRLNVMTYNYKSDPEEAKARVGLIAQQVQSAGPIISEFFVDEDETGMLSLKPSDLVFPLIAAVKKLTAKVEELEEKLYNQNIVCE